MRLPKPPTLDEVQAQTAHISPVPSAIRRPFWSVMIPTYNNGRYLSRTLQSVLSQALSPDDMQIEVVDGCSTEDDPQPIVEQLGGGRVTFHRLPSNQGAAHTFNVCIERAVGQWIHILHGDDAVLPGFYEAYARTIRVNPEARAVFGQVITIDEVDRWLDMWGPQPSPEGGILENFLEMQAVRQLVLFPGAVIHREVYEKVGGFCALFRHVTDWDMWFRAAAYAPVACVPQPYAFFRKHTGSLTNQLMVSARDTRECYFMVKVNLARLKNPVRVQEQSWRARLAKEADRSAWQLDAWNCVEGRYNQAIWAWMLEPNFERLICLAKSWTKRLLIGSGRGALGSDARS
jgi:glycosyltransferase involved in cell wall biosynthesis